MGEKKINLLVAMLKIIACYAVVSIHFGGTLPFAGLAVPVFMFFSFYYTKFDGGGLPRRIKRLGLPFLFWGIVPFIVHCVFSRRVDWTNLFSQLTSGAPENHPLYFLLLMMMYSIVVRLIENMADNESIWMAAFVVVCFTLQYSGVNARMWQMLPQNYQILCGRFSELLPAALAGRLLRNFRSNLEGRVWIVCGSCMLALFMLLFTLGVDSRDMGYDYSGITSFVGACGLCLITIVGGESFSLPQTLRLVILSVAGASAGIYYMHQFVGHVVHGYMLPKSYPELLVTPLVFALCLAASLVAGHSRYTKWTVA